MKKLLIAAAVAAAAAVPGVIGLAGNASFAQSVPVHVPAGASTIDDRGHHAEPGDDRGRHAEPGDDHGGASGPTTAATSASSNDGHASVSGPMGDDGAGHGGHDDGAGHR